MWKILCVLHSLVTSRTLYSVFITYIYYIMWHLSQKRKENKRTEKINKKNPTALMWHLCGAYKFSHISQVRMVEL